jgi:hypothetical protein
MVLWLHDIGSVNFVASDEHAVRNRSRDSPTASDTRDFDAVLSGSHTGSQKNEEDIKALVPQAGRQTVRPWRYCLLLRDGLLVRLGISVSFESHL